MATIEKRDDPALSVLLQGAIDDVRELATAEIALAKDVAKRIGASLLMALATIIAATVLAGIALATSIAMLALLLGGSASTALAAASATIAIEAGAVVFASWKLLPRNETAPPRIHQRLA